MSAPRDSGPFGRGHQAARCAPTERHCGQRRSERAEGTVLRLIPKRSRRWVVTAVMVVGLFGILGAAVTIQAQGIGDQERYDAVKAGIDKALEPPA